MNTSVDKTRREAQRAIGEIAMHRRRRRARHGERGGPQQEVHEEEEDDEGERRRPDAQLRQDGQGPGGGC